jgi:hypothetical protein
MIGNSAFLAAMIVLVILFFEMSGLQVLAPYKRFIFPRYIWPIVGAIAVLYLNIFAVVYLAARRLFLKDTGRKLAHVEKQLHTDNSVVRDLSEHLADED